MRYNQTVVDVIALSVAINGGADMSLSVVHIPIHFIVLAIATVSLGAETALPDSSHVVDASAAPVVAVVGDAENPAPPGSAWGVLTEITENQRAVADDPEKKKRVPKKETSKKDENQRDSGDSYRDSNYDDDGSDACVGACIGSFLSGIFNSSDEKEYESSYQEESVYTPTQTHAQYDEKPTQEKQEEAYPLQKQASAQYEDKSDQKMPWDEFTLAGFRLALDLSLWGFAGPSALVDEYMNTGGRYALSGCFNLGGTFEIEVDAGYSHINGKPIFDYETSTRLESPQSSHIQLFDTGVRFGMIHVFSSGSPILRWGLGPRVFWVKETADLKVYSLPGEIYLEDREEALEEWRLGGDIIVSMMWNVGSDFLVGFSTRFFVIPWESSYMKSLTLDHIGNKSVTGWSVGCTVHFNGL